MTLLQSYRSRFSSWIFIAALLLRLVPVLLTTDLGIGLDDMFQYDMLARSIASGNGYRWYAQDDIEMLQPYLHIDLSGGNYDPSGVLTSFRPPLYPFFLALIYLFSGIGFRRFLVVRLVQAFLGAMLAPLTYFLAKRILVNAFDQNDDEMIRVEKSARTASWVIALYPMLVIYPLSLATENLFILLVVCSTLALLKASDAVPLTKDYEKEAGCFVGDSRFSHALWRSQWFILAGFLLGLTALTRSVSLVFSGAVVFWIWIFLKNRKMALVVLGAMIVTILPWMIRNSLLHGRVSGIETALGYQLYVSYHPASSGTFIYPQSLDLMTILDDVERDEAGMALVSGFIRDDPARVPYLIIRRLGFFFGLERRALTYFYSNDFFGYIPAPLLLTFAAIVLMPFILTSTSFSLGMALVRWSREVVLTVLLMVGYIAPHLVIIAEDRFHLTLLPFLAVFASWSWHSGFSGLLRRSKGRRGKLALALASIAIVLLLVNWGFELWLDADKLIQLFSPLGNRTYFPY